MYMISIKCNKVHLLHGLRLSQIVGPMKKEQLQKQQPQY